MSTLKVTVIDVGWGDSLLIETDDPSVPDGWRYALVDSNDSSRLRSSYIFLKRYFERRPVPLPSPLFDWVLLTHAHSDHGIGLKRTLQAYSTRNFWYPAVIRTPPASTPVFFSNLLRFATRSPKVGHLQAVDNTLGLPAAGQNFGNVTLRVLWPPPNHQPGNENDNSVVLVLTLGQVSFVLGGDAEAGVWTQIAGQIPANTRVFKVPHHGSKGAMFDAAKGDTTPWLNALPGGAKLAISSHVRPFEHPDDDVIDELNQRGLEFYRTDQHHHVCFETDGHDVRVNYSHV